MGGRKPPQINYNARRRSLIANITIKIRLGAWWFIGLAPVRVEKDKIILTVKITLA
jgi:hypothetical protein